MTSRRLPRTLRPRAGSVVTGLFLGGLAVSATFAVLVGPLGESPALAQSMANPNDQPTPATVPSRDGTKAAGEVSPPSAIKSSTSVVSSDRKKSSYTNPLDHLPAKDRAGTGGRGE